MIDRACISLNHRCNLRCTYCYFASKETMKQATKSEFSPVEAAEVIKNIVAYCKKNGLVKFKLGVVGSGEPLLSYEALKAIVNEATQADVLIKLYTITNGVALTDEQISFFYANKETIELNFSLDGNELIHNALRQGYQQTMNSILRYEYLFGEKPRINTTVTRKTLEKKEMLAYFFIKNGFFKINFSIVVDVSDTSLTINRNEYEKFLDYCADKGIKMRQRREEIKRIYDCTKYGRLCGVGHTNIFITKAGIFPCGRFFGLNDYILAEYNAPISRVEMKLNELQSIDDGCCYYDTAVVRCQK